MERPLVSIVIPAYRESENLPIVYAEILETVEPLSDRFEFEFVLVNDGSPDTTWETIESLCDQDVRVKGVNLSRNFGKELAITAGLEYAKGSAVITIDADGQHPVERIPEFIEKWEAGYDIVYNKRPQIRGASWFKRITSKAFYAFFNAISEFKLEPGTTDYRLIDRAVVDAYLRFREKNRMYR